MIAFIEKHGEEEVLKIKKDMDDEFTVQKNNFIEMEKKKITENFKTRLANEEVRMRIEESKQ